MLIKKISIVFLIIFCVSTIGFSFWKWGEYLFVGYNQDVRMLTSQSVEFQNYALLQSSYSAKPIKVDTVDVYRSAPDTYDIAARVQNVNNRFAAKIKYKFVFAGGETTEMETVLLPATMRPLIFFGFKSADYPAGVRLDILGVQWQKVSAHDVPNVQQYMQERLRFAVNNFKYVRPSTVGAITHQFLFELSNLSSYGYRAPVFYVELLRNDQTVGYLYLTLDKLRAGDVRALDLRSLAPDLDVSDIQLIPVIDVFDNTVYMEPGV